MSQPRILLVEDDKSISHVIAAALAGEGYEIDCCETIPGRDARLSENQYGALITDVMLAGQDGIDALDHVKSVQPDLPIIVISAQNTLDTAVRASDAGVFEYFPKPFDLERLTEVVGLAIGSSSSDDIELDDVPEKLPLVGRSPAMQNVFRMIAQLMKNDLSVLILGESGTGKELVAEAIHNLGSRKSGPFVAINMAAIPAELIEAELFGHEKGAFTGAVNQAEGRFEQAQGGTLFLDEIGDMPMLAQTRLLRALQSGQISRVGGSSNIAVDVRIIAATHQNIEELIENGKFREDLYYRINVVPIDLPPLRERTQDIEALCKHFLVMARSEGLPSKSFDKGAIEQLMRHNWRGNVRQLRNLIYRLLVTIREPILNRGHITNILKNEQSDASVDLLAAQGEKTMMSAVEEICTKPEYVDNLHQHALAAIEIPLFEHVLTLADGNQLKAAAMLGINRNTLRKKLTEYGIEAGKLR